MQYICSLCQDDIFPHKRFEILRLLNVNILKKSLLEPCDVLIIMSLLQKPCQKNQPIILKRECHNIMRLNRRKVQGQNKLHFLRGKKKKKKT